MADTPVGPPARRAADEPLPILYRDDDYVIVDKPADLLVHRTAIDGDREAAVQRLRDQIGRRVWPVHRLDRPTSGVLAFGLSPQAASRLSRAFSERAVDKHYLAIVRAWPPESGVIDRPLKPAKGRNHQPARSRYARLATVELPIPVSRWPTARYALAMVAPDTGRFHQIRRHLNGLGHPVVGDVNHGDRHHNRLFREHFDCHRLLLHAWRLAFPHPETGEPVTVIAAPPYAMQSLADQFGWDTSESALNAHRDRVPPPGVPRVDAV